MLRDPMKEYHISWWNVENLFNTENYGQREKRLTRKLAGELKGWNKNVLNKKISNLSEIISKLNENKGPDILGMCEIEDDNVMQKLADSIDVNRNYATAHWQMGDGRGIDVGFIYDAGLFDVEEIFSHWLMKRNTTRDILQVNFKTKKGNRLVVIGNHWPSRISGSYDTEPFRMIAGEALAYHNQRIMDIHGNKTAILVMGDFNDEPFDRAITDYALGSSNKGSVSRSKSPKLFNPMWKLVADGKYTHVYGSEYTMLDQFMASKGLLQKKGDLVMNEDSVTVEKFKENSKGKKPKRFGRPSKRRSFNDKGYSDHFPISIKIIEN